MTDMWFAEVIMSTSLRLLRCRKRVEIHLHIIGLPVNEASEKMS